MKKNNKTNSDIISIVTRAKAAAIDPQHPDHQLLSESAGIEVGSSGHNSITEATKAIEGADSQADYLLSLVKKGSLEDFVYLPVTGLTVLAVMAKVDEETREKANKIISGRQSEIASKPRPGRQHKEKPTVRKYWDNWQKNPTLYPKRADFIRDMQERTGLNRAETIRKWMEEFCT